VDKAYQLEVEVQADRLLLHWSIAEGYYLYGDQFQIGLAQGQQNIRTQLQSEKGEVAYDDYFQKNVEKFRLFTTQTLLLPGNIDTQSGNFVLSSRFQGCADAGLCYPPETFYFAINFATKTTTAVADPQAMAAAPEATGKLSFALMFVFALLGGLILNLMPCVFPVLSIKLLSFAKSNESASHLKTHSWFYTFGVLSTFTLTALLLMVLRNAGAIIGWGFQLQSPIFIACLALLFLVLGLSLSGFINIGTRFMGVGQNLTAGSHYRNSFFTGVLAVIVASPCSVPFMGVALGYALTQPTAAALVIFLGLGIGLASPFLVFAYVPWLIQHLPKPGLWMEKLKHWLALPLYLSSVWLLWVLWHQLVLPTHTETNANQHWEKYSAQTLSGYLDNDEAVFVELTADWCITCLVNEKTSLNRAAVLSTMKTKNIHYLRGDWTKGDVEITALLKQYQRGGVPLYIYYGKNKSVTVLPQLLTEQIVLDTLNQ
jgi:thiol:disulfide interchange protein